MVQSVEHLGHLALDDEAREAFGDRGLADAGFADVQRIVLAPAAQDLDRALDFELAPDQRIDAARPAPCDSGWWCTSRARCRAFRIALALAPARSSLSESSPRRSSRGRARCS